MAVQYAFGKIVTQGLDLNVDAADPTSYPGSGTDWTSVVNRSITGSVVSCSYSSDFKGGIVFNNPSASVEFPGTVANYGTGSFTVEMAFRPAQIQGIHYLVSKNSGSYPNWGVYLSGSGGQGKLFAEYNIDASVSCSVSSSTTFVTGSNYFVDTIFDPTGRRVYQTSEGSYTGVSVPGNGTGSLTTTSSLFLGNTIYSSSDAYSGSIFSNKIYSTISTGYINYKLAAPRLGKQATNPSTALALLVGGGGGGGGGYSRGAGGGGGGVVVTSLIITSGIYYTVNVGEGGAGGYLAGSNSAQGNNGQTSSIHTVAEALGGGGGGVGSFNIIANRDGKDGGSGGGSSRAGNIGISLQNQGFDGGGSSGAGVQGAGGGGGAGAPGQFGDGNISADRAAGDGGIGFLSSISGTPTYYAGGGGAGDDNIVGIGGLGGGGNGGNNTVGLAAQNGQPNTGGGGGGGGGDYTITNPTDGGGAGGSGIVIIRYPGTPIASGGTITQVDGDTIHTFTATGSHTFTVF